MKLKKIHHLLGLGIHGERVCFVEIDRSGDRLHVRRVVEKALPFPLLTANPVLAGGELRKLLQEAGVQARQCVINLPMPWMLAMQTPLPDLPEEDMDSYLAMQAEREFPYAADDLARQTSGFTDSSGARHAITLAVARPRVETLLEIVRRARLKPLSLTVGVSQFTGNGINADAIALSAGLGHLEMAVLAQGKLAGLRSLDFLLNQGEDSSLDTQAIVRELRLTLAQLPDMLRSRIHVINVLGAEGLARDISQRLHGHVESLGLEMTAPAASPFPFEIAAGQSAPDTAVLSSVASFMLRGRSLFEFMPEHVSRMRQVVQRVSARGTLWISGAALAVMLIIGGAFIWQYRQLTQLESRWTAMAPHVTKVEDTQGLIRASRPWFDESLPSLRLLKQLTEAFPEQGTVWVKSLDVKDMNKVTCAGYAKSGRDWLTLHDRLLAIPGISNLEVQQVRGTDPVQFNFTYQWNEAAADGI